MIMSTQTPLTGAEPQKLPPVIDFQLAKEALFHPKAPVSADLTAAVETFAFSRLPKRERIARILFALIGDLEDCWQDFLGTADNLAPYAEKDFMEPYRGN